MCGRFVQAVKKEKVAERFDVKLPPEMALSDRYNLAPGQPAAVIVSGPAARPMLDICVWGLVPSWAKDEHLGHKLFNARVESLWEKPSFKDSLRYRRCLVPANGFYEWRGPRQRGQRSPWYFTAKDQPLFTFAGLWAVWNDRAGGTLHTFTIITRPANAFMSAYHHRMPSILPAACEADWLDSRLYRPTDVQPLLDACSEPDLEARPVSARINQIHYDAPDCIEPVPNDELFPL